jgi:hypothetical protein
VSDAATTVGPDGGRAAERRPLVVVDVDEVVLRFVAPLERRLLTMGYRFTPVTFAITGNVYPAGSARALPAEEVRAAIDAFYESTAAIQEPVEGAVAALARIADLAEVVLLSNLPERHAEARRRRLAELGIDARLLVNDGPKGPAVAALAGDDPEARGVVFVDDGPIHLASVRDRVAGVRLIQFVDDERFFRMAPAIAGVWLRTRSWHEVTERIEALFGGAGEAASRPPIAES